MSVLTPHWRRRLEDGRLEHFFPDADQDGLYVLTNPISDGGANARDGAILTRSIGTAIELVRRCGFSIQMTGNVTGERHLTPASDIECLA